MADQLVVVLLLLSVVVVYGTMSGFYYDNGDQQTILNTNLDSRNIIDSKVNNIEIEFLILVHLTLRSLYAPQTRFFVVNAILPPPPPELIFFTGALSLQPLAPSSGREKAFWMGVRTSKESQIIMAKI